MQTNTTQTKMSDSELRHKKIEYLQEYYRDPVKFLEDAMNYLGFECTDVQRDMMRYLASDDNRLMMLQAQRSQAKSTVTAIFCIWCLIHNPKYRILLCMSTEDLASAMTYLMRDMIMHWDILEPLRPGKGSRKSTLAFDVHKDLKGTDKSPSITCKGVSASIQGMRADIIIGDDVESAKNSKTAKMRTDLLNVIRDFLSICTKGKIIYLGTPQSRDSIYNRLPESGFDVRIWTGRYPTPEQVPQYKGKLAPFIMDRIAADPSLQTGGGINGDQGQPVDPMIIDEEGLQERELGQTTPFFQLQHMLNTHLLDDGLYPINLSDIPVMDLGKDSAPVSITFAPSPEHLVPIPVASEAYEESMYRPVAQSSVFKPYQHKMMYIDPAGGGKNGDETAYAVIGFLEGYFYVLDAGGVPGGYTVTSYKELTSIAKKYGVTNIGIESNHGNGAFRAGITPTLYADGYTGGVQDVWVSTQKELRILEALEAVISNHRLVFNSSIIKTDVQSVQKYDPEKQASYQLLYQLRRVTRRKGCLEHDDRLDALAGCVKLFLDDLKAVEQRRRSTASDDAFVQFCASKRPQRARNKAFYHRY